MTDTAWNFDITQAPTDGTAIWAACASGEVVKSYWLPPSGKLRPVGRWCFLKSTETPLAWTPFVKPKHPLAP